jgi:hypothetical protein
MMFGFFLKKYMNAFVLNMGEVAKIDAPPLKPKMIDYEQMQYNFSNPETKD